MTLTIRKAGRKISQNPQMATIGSDRVVFLKPSVRKVGVVHEACTSKAHSFDADMSGWNLEGATMYKSAGWG